MDQMYFIQHFIKRLIYLFSAMSELPRKLQLYEAEPQLGPREPLLQRPPPRQSRKSSSSGRTVEFRRRKRSRRRLNSDPPSLGPCRFK